MIRKISKSSGASSLLLPANLLLSLIGILGFGALMTGAGYYLGATGVAESGAASASAVDEMTEAVRDLLAEERDELQRVKRESQDHLDVLAMRLARLQAEVMRVDAVGERLVKLADLDSREFDFTNPPAVGGPTGPEAERSQSASDLIAGMSQLELLVRQRDEQLSVLEEWLMTNEVRSQVLPSGLPVFGGWVSSGFGGRINPVTGKRHVHTGVDIPGDRGEDVLAVAAGVVTKSERVAGYGNLVEIRHAEGYTTRYAHNEANLVNEGHRVEKGQVIALLGASGRTTGPHVHFEVRKDGSPINPARFIDAAD